MVVKAKGSLQISCIILLHGCSRKQWYCLLMIIELCSTIAQPLETFEFS